MYLFHGGTHRTRTLELKIRHRTAVCNPIFVVRHNLEIVAAPPKNFHRPYVSVHALLQNLEAHNMSCMQSLPIFAHYFTALGDDALRFGHMLHETPVT